MTPSAAIILLAASALSDIAASISVNSPAQPAPQPKVEVVAPAPAAEAPAAAASASTNAPPRRSKRRKAKVTAASTYYDHKEGIVIFSGNVHVDDEEYQMHAKKAYLFLSETNDLKRIVAMGGVALTNATRRAYGEKASYYRDTGLVVLYSGAGGPAEVREEKDGGDNVVKGRKIKFWVGREQVEVIEAEISAPARGLGEMGGIGNIGGL